MIDNISDWKYLITFSTEEQIISIYINTHFPIQLPDVRRAVIFENRLCEL